MCGIAGILHPGANRAIIESLTDTMISRGPDGCGYFVDSGIALGMRRLAVIDLENGGQPHFSQDKSIVAFQNGEIYNHKVLSRELADLGFNIKTNSDTEVLAHGYQAWGAEGLAKRLDGMYSVAIYDRNKRTLVLIRDRFGEKPLFIARIRGGFAYASDLRVLACLPGVGSEISQEGLNDYLALHYVPGKRTILKNIERVLPGEILQVLLSEYQPTTSRYYTLPIGINKRISDEDLGTLIESAVTSRLVADVPVGVFLSGGLDSSIVAAIAAKHTPNISTFSMGFQSQQHDESDHARFLASHIGTNHHHFTFDSRKFIELLPQVAKALDEPIGDQALLPVFWLCKEASSHCTVVMAGEGADEVFGGYNYYSQFSKRSSFRQILSKIFKAKDASRMRLINNSIPETPSGFPLLTDIEGRHNLIGSVNTNPDDWESELLSWLTLSADTLQRATCTDLATWLPDNLLVKFDRMAMANSLEGRAPFLEYRLVEAGTTRLSSADRYYKGVSKIALRRVSRQWIPHETLSRKKQGFVLPMRQWIAEWENINRDITKRFSEISMAGCDFQAYAQSLSLSIANEPKRERYHFASLMFLEWALAFSRSMKELGRTINLSCIL